MAVAAQHPRQGAGGRGRPPGLEARHPPAVSPRRPPRQDACYDPGIRSTLTSEDYRPGHRGERRWEVGRVREANHQTTCKMRSRACLPH